MLFSFNVGSISYNLIDTFLVLTMVIHENMPNSQAKTKILVPEIRDELKKNIVTEEEF